jgi:hypothetical protein
VYSKLLIGILAAGSLVTLEASLCTSGTLASYVALPATGCDEGPFTFTSFTFSFSILSGSPAPASASDINLTPDNISGTLIGFDFTPINDTVLKVTNNDAIQYSIAYTVDYPPIIVGGQGDANDPNSGPGTTTITETLNPVALPPLPPPPAICSTLLPLAVTIMLSLDKGTHSAMQTAEFTHRTCMIDDITTITLSGNGSGGVADLGELKEYTGTPEPSYGFFCGLGAALVVVSRRVLRRR